MQWIVNELFEVIMLSDSRSVLRIWWSKNEIYVGKGDKEDL
jgi:hypothetical protein